MKTLLAPSASGSSRPIGSLVLALAGALALTAHGQFTPGSGGSIPDIPPLTGVANRIPGLLVEKSERENNFFGGGTRACIDMEFPTPSTYGATGYQLQRAAVGSSTWTNYMATTSDNNVGFSIYPDGIYQYRLVVQGGTKSGYISNVVTAGPAAVDTYFSGWGMEESMTVSGTMWPWVGRGLTASFAVKTLADGTEVTGCLSYQWYRVNPLSYDMTAIPGATDLTYITTEDDLGGYQLMCRATANETTAGGFVQVMGSSGILIPNKAFISGLTANGFYLNLYKTVPSLVPADLKLSYWDNVTEKKVTISKVTASGSNAKFWISANIPAGVSQLQLSNVSDVWSLADELAPGHLMQMLQINVPTEGFAPEIAVLSPSGGGLTDNVGTRLLGNVLVGETATAATFTVQNTGTAMLSGLAITKNGTNAADFTVGPLTATSLLPGKSATFKVTFKPGAAGTRTAAIHIASNDADEDPFDINLSGSGIAPTPEIVVMQPAGTSLVDAKSTRNFGTVVVGSKGVSKVFTIKNTGTAALKEIDVKIGGTYAADYVLIEPTVIKLLPGESTTFRVTFKPKAKGVRKAALKIYSNDANEDPFDIVLTGTGG